MVKFQFNARGDKAPVELFWHEGGSKPELRPEWGIDKLPDSGMVMIGEKKTLITGGRPNKPRLMVSDEEWNEFLKKPPAQTIPRVGEEMPQQEWLDCIKNGTLPGSNFDYAASLNEMVMVGVIAQRFATRIEYDGEKMQITNQPELNAFVKEPVREGWSFGEDLW